MKIYQNIPTKSSKHKHNQSSLNRQTPKKWEQNLNENSSQNTSQTMAQDRTVINLIIQNNKQGEASMSAFGQCLSISDQSQNLHAHSQTLQLRSIVNSYWLLHVHSISKQTFYQPPIVIHTCLSQNCVFWNKNHPHPEHCIIFRNPLANISPHLWHKSGYQILLENHRAIHIVHLPHWFCVVVNTVCWSCSTSHPSNHFTKALQTSRVHVSGTFLINGD